MNITNISADVRIVNYGSPFEVADNLVVEERVPSHVPGLYVWQRYWGTNELSNDFAYNEVHAHARALAARRLVSIVSEPHTEPERSRHAL